MIQKLNLVKKEAISILLIIIGMAFLVSSLSNVIFEKFYASNTTIYIVAVCALLVLLSLISYVFFASSLASSKKSVKMNFTFNHESGRFIDIPHCPSAVNARVEFDKLEESKRIHLASCAYLLKFSGSELERFIDDVVQKILLNNILKRASYSLPSKDVKSISVNEAPDNIRENWVLIKNTDRKINFNVISSASIKALNPRRNYFKIECPYGNITFNWYNSFSQTAYDSGAFLESVEEVNPEKCCDLHSEVIITAKVSYFRLLSSKTKTFANWSAQISEEVEDWDWSRAQKNHPVILLGRILKKLNKKA